jgi:hypothetical protein
VLDFSIPHFGSRHKNGFCNRAYWVCENPAHASLLAAAINFMRVAAWLAHIPRAQTRPSAFAALAAASG